jgi:hypothetical protein
MKERDGGAFPGWILVHSHTIAECLFIPKCNIPDTMEGIGDLQMRYVER